MTLKSKLKRLLPTSLPEELHLEILKRLLPTPQVLARASAVCREWRRVMNDPGFLKEMYRGRRGAPVTLGFFHNFDDIQGRFIQVDAGDPVRMVFEPVVDGMTTHWQFMDSHHGRVLLYNGSGIFMVCHPMTGDRCYVQVGGLVDGTQIQSSAALICECSGDDDQNQNCHVSHFRVAVVSNYCQLCYENGKVFSSLTGMWRKSAQELPLTHVIRPEHCVVVGKTLYQLLSDYLVLAFDTDTLSQTMFDRPKWGNVRLLKTDDGVLGLAGVLGFTLRLWARYGDAWVMRKTVDLSEMLGAPWPETDPRFTFMSPVKIIGVTDMGEALFLWTMIGVFMLCLESMVVKKVCGTTNNMKTVYPYGASYLPPAVLTQKLRVKGPYMSDMYPRR